MRTCFMGPIAALTVALALAGCGERSGRNQRPQDGTVTTRTTAPSMSATNADRAQIRDVIRRFNEASLAGDSTAMCALVDPAKLRYLEQIGLPCEISLGGTLTPASERDVRSRTISSIDVKGDNAVAHTTGTDGPRDLRLRRSVGHWLIVGV